MLTRSPFNILQNLEHVDRAIDNNANLADDILVHGLPSYGLQYDWPERQRNWRGTASSEDFDKARLTIKQFYRDWSAEGAAERNACNEPVLKDIDRLYGDVEDKGAIRVLVPGAGLGRLVFELCKNGYNVEGNEISYHMAIASLWALNYSQRAHRFMIYPFVHDFNNVVSRSHQLQGVNIPDVHPPTELLKASALTRTPAHERLKLSTSDFLRLCDKPDYLHAFDVVATVFFIDTAPNLIRYIVAVQHCLKPGGVWINIGPLLWHFNDRSPPNKDQDAFRPPNERNGAGIEEPGSVELTAEEVMLLVEHVGFDIEREEIKDGLAGYLQNPESLQHNVYRLVHWVARKRPLDYGAEV